MAKRADRTSQNGLPEGAEITEGTAADALSELLATPRPGQGGAVCRVDNDTGERALDELSELFATPERVILDGEVIYLEPLKLHELPRLWAVTRGIPLDGEADFEEALATRAEDVMEFLEIITRQTFEVLSALPASEFDDLMAAARRANRRLFAGPLKGHPLGTKARAQIGWSEALAGLVEAGHSFAEIRNYSLGQVELLSRAHARLTANRRCLELAIHRAARADAKGYKKVFTELTKAAERCR